MEYNDTLQYSEPKPLRKIGIIADVQYADIDDKYNVQKTHIRFYRKSLTLLRRAVTEWAEQEVDGVLQLGDIIDGFNKSEDASKSALETILDILKLFPGPVYHTWGNHELYNFTQEELMTSALFSGNLPQCECPEGKTYYSFDIHRQIKVLVINCYEVSMLGLPEVSTGYKETETLIRENNPNENINSPAGLNGTSRRFAKVNGGVSASQQAWLADNLREAIKRETNVIVMGHCPIYENGPDHLDYHLLLNYADVMQILSNYSACVVSYFSGHDHQGGSGVDSSGILHVTFPGVIETQEEDASAIAYIYNDRLAIKGKGRYSSFETKLRYPIKGS